MPTFLTIIKTQNNKTKTQNKATKRIVSMLVSIQTNNWRSFFFTHVTNNVEINNSFIWKKSNHHGCIYEILNYHISAKI